MKALALLVSSLVVALLSVAGVEASPASRVALVVGNARYESAVGPLRNTNNDARAMARTLRTLGFEVSEKHDLSRDQFLEAMAAFSASLKGAEIGLFYYAGHGISVDGANYLIPIRSGFSPAGSDAVTLRMLAETRLFNAEQAVADMAASGAKCNLVILDACRTTRLPAAGRTREAGAAGGLAEMTPPAGSLIAFSTDAGRTAYDGDGANGLYTAELLKNLAAPGLTIEQVFKRTRAAVLKRSDGEQLPAEYSRLVGDDIYLAGLVPVLAAEPVDSMVARSGESEADLLARAAKSSGEKRTGDCLDALNALRVLKGPGDYAAEPIDALLEQIKNDLKNEHAPLPTLKSDLETCEALAAAIPEFFPADDVRGRELLARAQNRRGDCLLELGRSKEALGAFDAAAALRSDDAYIFYNRGRAHLALGDRSAAKADFETAAESRFKQPGARRLAIEALADLK